LTSNTLTVTDAEEEVELFSMSSRNSLLAEEGGLPS
jgi:hypothetical protein